jgi:hypothetical protein
MALIAGRIFGFDFPKCPFTNIIYFAFFYNAFFLLKGIINRPNKRCNALLHLRLWSPAEVEEEAEAR